MTMASSDDRFVVGALGVRLVCSNRKTDDHVVYRLDENGKAISARPATTLEVQMWRLLLTPQARWDASGGGV